MLNQQHMDRFILGPKSLPPSPPDQSGNRAVLTQQQGSYWSRGWAGLRSPQIRELHPSTAEGQYPSSGADAQKDWSRSFLQGTINSLWEKPHRGCVCVCARGRRGGAAPFSIKFKGSRSPSPVPTGNNSQGAWLAQGSRACDS